MSICTDRGVVIKRGDQRFNNASLINVTNQVDYIDDCNERREIGGVNK